MSNSYFILALIMLGHLSPLNVCGQNARNVDAINHWIKQFEGSLTLQTQDSSLCSLYDDRRDRDSCIDRFQFTSDGFNSRVERYKFIKGRKRVDEETAIYYCIDKKLCKMVVKKTSNGKMIWNSEIYLAGDNVLMQKDSDVKVNALYFIQEARRRGF